jgi:hypothetical protein
MPKKISQKKAAKIINKDSGTNKGEQHLCALRSMAVMNEPGGIRLKDGRGIGVELKRIYKYFLYKRGE